MEKDYIRNIVCWHDEDRPCLLYTSRAHILEGLLIALDHIDEVIATIRSSQTDEIARNALMQKFGLSEKQAVAIPVSYTHLDVYKRQMNNR